MSLRRFLPRLALALVVVAAVAWAAVHRDQINLATLDAWLDSLGPWAPIGYVILYALATVAFVPGAIFALAGGALFGPVWGSLWNLAGRHARRHPCVPGRAHHRRRLGRTQSRRARQAPHRRCRRGGLAFRRLRAAGPVVPLQPLELRAGAHPHPAPPLRHRHARLHGCPARSPIPGSGMPDAGR